MDGYHNLPEETAETLEDGWLHTGDIGELDADGFLRITGRKKDLFKTSGGKYIAPPAIESQFKAICPYASQFLVHGNERNFVLALITLDPDAMAAGPRRTAWRQVVRRDRRLDRLSRRWSRATSTSSTPS
jgi:long-chain acyl-CoA synthetase